MKYCWIPVLLAFSCGLLPAQTVVLRESFDTTWSSLNPPAGWRITYTEPPVASEWHRAPDMGPNPWDVNPTPYALLWNDPQRYIADSLTTPIMDCSGLAGIALRCSTTFGSQFPREFSAKIVGSTDGGGTWDFLVREYRAGVSIAPTAETLSMAWAGGHDQVLLAWVFEGQAADFDYWALDNVTVTGVLPGADVGVVRIAAPADTVDSGTVVTPSATVRNLGVTSASFNVRFRIGTFYDTVETVNALPPADSAVLQFAAWTAVEGGNFAVTCSTELTGDIHPENDARRDSVNVRAPRPDVGVEAIIAPADTADTLQVIVPGATVRNFGNLVADFPLIMQIGARYADTQTVVGLNPGSARNVAFRAWDPEERGLLNVRCSTALDGDLVPQNDLVSGVVFSRIRDVGVSRIVAPRGVVMENSLIAPSAVVTNYGNTLEFPQVLFQIVRGAETTYADVQQLVLAPGAQDTAVLSNWLAAPAGDYRALARTLLGNDANPGNDMDSAPVIVALGITRDVGVVQILRPRGRMPVGPVRPAALVKNFGQGAGAFRAYFVIRDDTGVVYRDSGDVEGLNGGEQTTLAFPEWLAGPGRYAVQCSTALPGDSWPFNDVIADSVAVESLATGWLARAPVPPGAKNKNVKDGGALAAGRGSDSTDQYIYSFKGNGTCEFYGYNTVLDAWSALESVPAVNRAMKKKGVKKGSSLVAGPDRKVYATKGNGLLDFWQYDPALRTWTQLEDVPPGTKACKEGTSSVALVTSYADGSDTGFVYLLKGSNTFEFYRYNIETGVWDISLPPAPGGTSTKPFKSGSSITYDGGDTIYCLKGSYNEFFAYSLSGRSWVTRETLPKIAPPGTKKTKAKDGSQLAWFGGSVYTLKGNNTNEFWQYKCTEQRWDPAPQMPEGTKKVKGGGGLVYADGPRVLYALRGNSTLEFWRYYDVPATGVVEKPEPVTPARPGLTIAPNPFAGDARVSYTLTRAGDVSLRLYDVTGKLVTVLAGGHHPAGKYSLQLAAHSSQQKFAAGVYLLELEACGLRLNRKLVIE
jgi:hypothetical protein